MLASSVTSKFASLLLVFCLSCGIPLLVGATSVGSKQSAANIHLNTDLCRYVGAGSGSLFHKENVDYCQCSLNGGLFNCEAYRIAYLSRVPYVVGKFEAGLALGSPKLNSFLFLFASTDNCNLGQDDDTGRIGCCMFGVKEEGFDIKPSLQLGIVTSLTLELDKEPKTALETSEFERSMSTYFPQEGAGPIPPHCFRDFSIKIDAPAVFKGIRHIQGVDEREFIMSIGNSENRLKNLGKLGGSGNGFYLTHDDKYFIKTTNQDEYENFMKILPQYFRYMQTNPHSLLSRFAFSFEYKSNSLDTTYLITNNLLPSTLVKPQKFDLKGSTVNRKTSEKEMQTKKSITFKDLDFLEMYPDGFLIHPKIHDKLMKALRADVEFLLSQRCLDYSLLVGAVDATQEMLEAIDTDSLEVIPAKTKQGQDKLLYVGIIDILQPYSSLKKIESNLKSIIYDRSSITIVKPDDYAQRFQKFVGEKVFKAATLLEMFKE